MSTAPTIAKLEALLARIRTRAAEARSQQAAPVAAPPPPAVVPVVSAPVVVVAPVVAAREPTLPPPAVEEPTLPPPSPIVEESTLPPPYPVAASDSEFAVEVDVSDVALEASVAPPERVDDAHAGGPADSQERLAVIESAPPESPLPTTADASDAAPAIEQVEVLSDDESLASGEDEEIEESPASSRRAVVSAPEERLAQLAFGTDEQPQRHTPPPKSGRLPAPPGVEFEGDITGIHKTEAISIQDEATQLSSPGAPASALTPQASRPTLASSVNVVDVIGQAQSFSPSTFVELLDASLAL